MCVRLRTCAAPAHPPACELKDHAHDAHDVYTCIKETLNRVNIAKLGHIIALKSTLPMKRMTLYILSVKVDLKAK